MFTLTQNKWKIDDVLGVWPLHGLCGAWGGIAAGIFGSRALGGIGGVNLWAQLVGVAIGVAWALVAGAAVYGVLQATLGLRLAQEEEYDGADLSIHHISATAGARSQLVARPGPALRRRGGANFCDHPDVGGGEVLQRRIRRQPAEAEDETVFLRAAHGHMVEGSRAAVLRARIRNRCHSCGWRCLLPSTPASQ